MKFFVTFTLIVLNMAVIAIFPDDTFARIIKGIIGFCSLLAGYFAMYDINKHMKD